MKAKLTVLVAFISIFTLICFSYSFAALPGDTLRTDTGEIIIVPDYGTPGVDYADSQFPVFRKRDSQNSISAA